MWSREEAQERRKEFWTAFGVFMRKHIPLSHPKARWLNYKTGVRDVYFRLEADNTGAKVCIDIQHRDAEIRELFYEQFTELKVVLHDIVGEEMKWDEHFYFDEIEKEISRIYVQLPNKNIYRKDDWSEIFHFLEKHIVTLDEFWADYKDIFIELQR